MNFEVVNNQQTWKCKVNKDGNIPQDSILGFKIILGISDNIEEGYDFCIVISKQEIKKTTNTTINETEGIPIPNVKEWKKNEDFDQRKNWVIYQMKITPPKPGQEQEYFVDKQWWRDVARSLIKEEKNNFYCYLIYEDGKIGDDGMPSSPQKIEVSSCLQKLETSTKAKLYSNEAKKDVKNGETSQKGFAHHQEIKINNLHPGMYTIVQWVQGVFIQWDGDNSTLKYRYLKVPSCGYDSEGYLPEYVQDGSQDSGTPNFFEIDKGLGVDEPGDLPDKKKTWDDFSKELMALRFETQVYLSCDVTGGINSVPTKEKDPLGKDVLINKQITFKPKELVKGELKGAELEKFNQVAWEAVILQLKDQDTSKGYNFKLDDVIKDTWSPPITIPKGIKDIIKAAFKANQPAPMAVIE
ncbi:MAG: hypothetical protein F6K36_23870 [Symploca sp. SIO3C6]|nr:hypothetical protein [Symploca sp. SIO3C6]